MEHADSDASIEAFCKINEQRHTFLRFRYVKESGLPGFYWPDFLAQTTECVYLAETKAQGQLEHPDVKRKQRAAVAWCARINELPAEERANRTWHYALVGEAVFNEFTANGASMRDLLHFARLRDVRTGQQQLI